MTRGAAPCPGAGAGGAPRVFLPIPRAALRAISQATTIGLCDVPVDDEQEQRTWRLSCRPYRIQTPLWNPTTRAKTFSFHYGKHHKAYVDNLNKLLPGSPFENSSLEEIIRATAGDQTKAGFFNNAAQVWNHTFFWNCMTPGGGGRADRSRWLRASMPRFGSYEKFAEQFKAAAVGRFGSGWAWLISEMGELKIMSTPNAENPMSLRKDRASHCRRVGARLLPRLPESPA